MNLDELRSLYDFSGRTVLVTGGTGVLAWEIVTTLAQCNANVVVLSRNHEQGSMLMAEDFKSVKGRALHVYFRPDGKSLISTYLGVVPIIIWDLDPESWIQKACQIAGRNLTQEEWAQYFPDEAYRKTCEQWP